MNAARLDWYFDFISPFAYLQWRRLRRDHPEVALNPKPLLFAAILNHVGQLGPAEIPQKRRHTYRIVLWQARAAGIPPSGTLPIGNPAERAGSAKLHNKLSVRNKQLFLLQFWAVTDHETFAGMTSILYSLSRTDVS